MKALLERAGFTKMIELHQPRPVYEMHVEVKPVDMNAMTIKDLVAQVNYRYWIFRLDRVQFIDNEQVAFYKFYEER